MSNILNGKKLSEEILMDLKKKVQDLDPITLAVILAGDNPKSLNFINQKKKAAEKIGVGFRVYNFPVNIGNRELTNEVKKIVENKENTGILVQLPLPEYIHTDQILNLIPGYKDVDALSVDNPFLESPTASGIIELLVNLDR